MSECEKYRELISASIDDELDDAECAALKKHLEACPDCRRISEAFSAISGGIQAEEAVPDGFAEGTMFKIRQEAARPSGIRKFTRLYGRYTGMAAILVILLEPTWQLILATGNVLSYIFMAAMALITIISGVDYLKSYWKYIRP